MCEKQSLCIKFQPFGLLEAKCGNPKSDNLTKMATFASKLNLFLANTNCESEFHAYERFQY